MERLLRPGSLRALVVVLALAACLYGAAAVWAGWAEVWQVMRRIGWQGMLLAAVCSSASYLFRFARWRFCLQRLGSVVPWRFNLAAYLAGLALTASPGKLGETVRSVLLLRHGVPPTHSLAAFLADRMGDVLGVCLLGAVTGVLAGAYVGLMSGAFVLCLLASGILWLGVTRSSAALAKRLHASRLPVLRLGPDALAAWAELWGVRRIPVYVLSAMLAYGMQALVFAFLCARAGIEIDVAQAMAIFAFATLFGAASMAPGGLGAMEGALVVQLGLLGVPAGLSVPVAMAVRLVTLWLGMFIGVLAMLGCAAEPLPERK
jgi:glycosyltransferase 2 family protein